VYCFGDIMQMTLAAKRTVPKLPKTTRHLALRITMSCRKVIYVPACAGTFRVD
jgi:hypothetical protein